jgi:hypothetical protein
MRQRGIVPNKASDPVLGTDRLLIYLIASLDNPYRRHISVSPEPLQRVYEQIMVTLQ